MEKPISVPTQKTSLALETEEHGEEEYYVEDVFTNFSQTANFDYNWDYSTAKTFKMSRTTKTNKTNYLSLRLILLVTGIIIMFIGLYSVFFEVYQK